MLPQAGLSPVSPNSTETQHLSTLPSTGVQLPPGVLTRDVAFLRSLHYLNFIFLNSKMGINATSLLLSCFGCRMACHPSHLL